MMELKSWVEHPTKRLRGILRMKKTNIFSTCAHMDEQLWHKCSEDRLHAVDQRKYTHIQQLIQGH